MDESKRYRGILYAVPEQLDYGLLYRSFDLEEFSLLEIESAKGNSTRIDNTGIDNTKLKEAVSL